MTIGHSVSNSAGIILAIDQPLADFLGRPISEIVNRSYLDFTHPDDRYRNDLVLKALRPGDPAVTISKRYIRGDGSVAPASMLVSRLPTGAEGGSLVGTLLLRSPTVDDPLGLWERAMRMLLVQEQRRAEMGEDLAAEPLWTMMLQIYLAEAEGRVITAQRLATLMNAPEATAHRWIKVLTNQNMIEHVHGHADACQFTAQAISKIERVLASTPAI